MSILERFSLRGKVALVTAGAGPQFGQSLSAGLAEAGATLITASRSRERNDEWAATLRSRGYDAHGLQMDVESLESIDALHAEVYKQFGRCDVLVNSALARDGHKGTIQEQTADVWRHAAEGDFLGLFRICQLFAESMAEQGSGSIINISSIYGVVANDPSLYEGTIMKQPPTYNFVKAGMINYTRQLASYYGKRGVRANCISPGGYANNQPQPFVDAYCKRSPLGRLLGHEDIKGAAVFLASDASNYVTGHNLMVDGGWTIV
ncbi:MAG: SDR family oxidoreductase [Planctomycetales bacterium]|nr:SDR family oxidoreductase [Planctomycetales bacterium]MBN8624949.1 SDR family oxidoreductase [Planctomycetota bacterium]